MECKQCGAAVQPGTKCRKCGAFAEGPAPAPGPAPAAPGGAAAAGPGVKSKLAAGLLGIFLGWLGVHRFYLGYNAIGGVMLAISIVGLILTIPTCGAAYILVVGVSIWGLIEGILILTGGINKDADGRPLVG